MGYTEPLDRPETGALLELECLADGCVHVLSEHRRVNIGGLPDNQIQIKHDPHVSRNHARLWYQGGYWHIQDLGSTNGTDLNGAYIERAKIKPGDLMRIGKTEFFVRDQHKSKATDLPGVIAVSKAMQPVKRAVLKAAQNDLPVFLTGQPGTGKTMLAEVIHKLSKRKDQRFEQYHASKGLSADNMWSDLFGYSKGAFTGAYGERLGLFRTLDGGTVLLDEIGDMDDIGQQKLLHVIEQGVLQPFGSDEWHKVDVRIIAATNQPLHKLRTDLLGRLQQRIHLPPLCERKEDILILARMFMAQMGAHFPLKVLRDMQSYSWPGNVRQLKTTIKLHAVDSGRTWVNLGKETRIQKARRLQTAINHHGGKIAPAARELRISRPTAYRLKALLEAIKG